MKLFGSIISLVLCLGANSGAGSDAASVFNDVSSSLAIITAGTSTGSGFLCEISGRIRLVTNEHVLRKGRPISASLINGRKLKLGSTIQLSNDSDLAIIDIVETNDLATLVLSQRAPLIGEQIYVFGNSDGGGVATALEGKIIGIGPDRIEIDAAFVLGNSGSPIMFSDKSVVAVATYVQRSTDPKDWVKKGTRFEDTRRFGLLLSNRTWISTTPKEYFNQITLFEDIATYCSEILEMGKRQVGDDYIYGRNSYKYVTHKGLCQLIHDYSIHIKKLSQDIDEVEKYKRVKNRMQAGSEKELMGSYYDSKIQELENQRNKSALNYRRHAAQMIQLPTKWLNDMKWSTKRFQSESVDWVAILGIIGLDKEWIQISD